MRKSVAMQMRSRLNPAERTRSKTKSPVEVSNSPTTFPRLVDAVPTQSAVESQPIEKAPPNINESSKLPLISQNETAALNQQEEKPRFRSEKPDAQEKK